MPTPAYVGLMTGSGAADGLETLLARMRAEELLRQRSRQMDIEEEENINQSGYRNRQLDMMGPYYEALTTGAAANTAQTNLENEKIQEQLGLLRGLRPEPQMDLRDPNLIGGQEPLPDMPPDDINSMNNPSGRLRLHLAGVAPSTIFPAMESQVSISGEEADLDAYARKIGKNSRHELNFDERIAAKREMPQYQLSSQRVEQGEERLNLMRRQFESVQRDRTLRMELAKKRFEQELPAHVRGMALAEFSNRILYDLQSQPNWIMSMFGAEDPGTSAQQIDKIAQEIIQKYATPSLDNTSPSGGATQTPGGIDAILEQRRRNRAGTGQRPPQ